MLWKIVQVYRRRTSIRAKYRRYHRCINMAAFIASNGYKKKKKIDLIKFISVYFHLFFFFLLNYIKTIKERKTTSRCFLCFLMESKMWFVLFDSLRNILPFIL